MSPADPATPLQPAAIETSARFYADGPSVRGKLWRMAPHDGAEVARIARAYDLPEMVAGLLHTRGVALADVPAFLSPMMRDHFPDPAKLQDMDKAAQLVADAIIDGRKVGLFVDFDVDGATSGAILTRFLRAVGRVEVPVYVPDRMTEGYGPNPRAFEVLKEKGCDVVVVADCGITSHVPLSHAAELGLKMIVVDHHEPEETLPIASAIVNPKRRDCTSGYTMMAACALSFLLCVAVNAKLRAAGYYQNGRAEPLLKNLLDLVALGTVCDMAPMTGANRLFVKYGFPQMGNTTHAGMKALFAVSKITSVPEPFHAGFLLGPRINAGGRIHESDLGVRLLSTDDHDEAVRIAHLLDDCNTERRQMQKDMLAQAVGLVHAHGYDSDAGLVLEDKDWHPGLVGLIAGDLKERFGRPACAIAYTDANDGYEGRGSGRSVAGINIAAAFLKGRDEGHLIKGGGHAMAGGFTVAPDKVDAFRAFFVSEIAVQRASLPQLPVLEVDGVLPLRALTPHLAALMNKNVAPYGIGHAEPTFIIENVVIAGVDTVGTNHVRCMIRDANGGPTIKAIAFKAGDGPLGRFLKDAATGSRQPVTLAGCVQLNVWQGRESAEFQITDAR